MKQYLLSVCYPADGAPPAEAELERIKTEVRAVRREMQAAGVWVFGGALRPPAAASVLRERSGETVVTDGPFIESKEQIGGITILKTPDLDTALSWSRRLARATTTAIEVRPFVEDVA